MKIKWLKREHLKSPLHIAPGDTLELRYRSSSGIEKTVLKRQTLKKEMLVNELGVFQFEDWENMEEGYGGVFGVSSEKQ